MFKGLAKGFDGFEVSNAVAPQWTWLIDAGLKEENNVTTSVVKGRKGCKGSFVDFVVGLNVLSNASISGLISL